eukprot:TRINITY_DN3283_c0_g2_i1.p1 TRINITY_DN3283_c0_g2~~TRINITY_DN3283_c0_g2_i1.p1  ORF type:complete len:1199 (+),score=236.71 TRINITY_DN3283_c0_g2_i1:30-3599(+)
MSMKAVQGLLQVLGSLNEASEKKKYEKYFVKIADGELIYYSSDHSSTPTTKARKGKKKKSEVTNSEAGGCIDVLPLTGAVLEFALGKKEKTPTKFVFVLTGLLNNRKWRTVFCTESAERLEEWKRGVIQSIDLATSAVFNTTIEDACQKSNSYVPNVVRKCIEEIDNHLLTVGLFRVPGDKNKINLLREAFDRGETPLFSEDEEVHLVCSLLKAYLSEIRDPLIPFALYASFIAAANLDDDKRLAAIQDAVKELSLSNRAVLAYLVEFLRRVEKEHETNKMDTTNLGVVFGPTVLRNNNPGSVSSAKNMGLADMASSNRCLELLITHGPEIFSDEDRALFTKEVYDMDLKALKQRDVMTAAEAALIEPVLKSHLRQKLPHNRTVFDISFSRLVNVINSKTSEPEARILIADYDRIFLFLKGGRLEVDFHLLDIISIKSLTKACIEMEYQTARMSAPSVLTVHPVSFGSPDLDNFYKWLNNQYAHNFIGRAPERRFSTTLAPSNRKAQLEVLPDIDEQSSCAGIVASYRSVCGWLGSSPHEDIIWDLENFFPENDKRDFNVVELVAKDKFPNPEFEALLYCLRYNQWFTRFESDIVGLGDVAVCMIGDMLKENTTLKEVVVKNSGAGGKGLTSVFNALKTNVHNSLQLVSIPGSALDQKACSVMNVCLSVTIHSITSLNLSNVQLNKKTFPLVLTTLHQTVNVLSHLEFLDLSRNRFDDPSSVELGKLLSKTLALKELNVHSTAFSYTKTIEGMINGSDVSTCPSLRTINLSDNSLKIKQVGELVDFCKYLPNLACLNIGGACSGLAFASHLVELCSNNLQLRDLDVSECDLTDDGCIVFMDYLAGPDPKVSLEKLSMNYAFNKKSKSRSLAMRSITRALNKTRIQEFVFKGGRGAYLKSDLTDMIFGLLNNESLEILDVSGHQSGDPLAVALAKVLQHNSCLHTIFMDGNQFAISGLRSLMLGLKRNTTVKHMPLPLLDISSLIRSEEKEDQSSKLFTIAKNIQKKLFENALVADFNAIVSPRPGGLITPRGLPSSPSSLPPLAIPKSAYSRPRSSSRVDERRAQAVFGSNVFDEGEEDTMDQETETEDQESISSSMGSHASSRQSSSVGPSPSPTLKRAGSMQVMSNSSNTDKFQRSLTRPVKRGNKASTFSSGMLNKRSMKRDKRSHSKEYETMRKEKSTSDSLNED